MMEGSPYGRAASSSRTRRGSHPLSGCPLRPSSRTYRADARRRDRLAAAPAALRGRAGAAAHRRELRRAHRLRPAGVRLRRPRDPRAGRSRWRRSSATRSPTASASPCSPARPRAIRFYSRWGLSASDISRIVVFYSGTFWLGLLVLGGWSLVLNPPSGLAGLEIHRLDIHRLATPLGVTFLGVSLAYAVATFVARGPMRVFGVEFTLPDAASGRRRSSCCRSWTGDSRSPCSGS